MTTTDDFTDAARAEAEKQWTREPISEHPLSGPERMNRRIGFAMGAEWARDHLAAQEPTEAEVEAARAAYWPAYSEAVRDAPSNKPGQGISAEDGRKAGLAGHRAALSAARAARRDEEKR